MTNTDNTPAVTPVELRGDIYLKRDDLYCFAGIRGGKVRSCKTIAEHGLLSCPVGAPGLVTASSRVSPQMQIVARVAERLGVPARCHTPTGASTPEMDDARRHGAEIIQHKAGYNNVICARARADADLTGWVHIPFGMEHAIAVGCTTEQAIALCRDIVMERMPKPKRLVVPLGSGMSAIGILRGIRAVGVRLPVLGVAVGGSPIKRLDAWFPSWRSMLEVVVSKHKYDDSLSVNVNGVAVDPRYEAKAVEYLEPGDLFWIVGIRAQPEPETTV